MLFVDRYEKSVDMVRAAIEKYSPEMMPDIQNAEEYMNTKSPDITFTENNVQIRSAMTDENKAQIEALAEELCRA